MDRSLPRQIIAHFTELSLGLDEGALLAHGSSRSYSADIGF
jgi:hypothetical protein